MASNSLVVFLHAVAVKFNFFNSYLKITVKFPINKLLNERKVHQFRKSTLFWLKTDILLVVKTFRVYVKSLVKFPCKQI